MRFAEKMRAWMPLHENGVSRAVHLLGVLPLRLRPPRPRVLAAHRGGRCHPRLALHALVAAVALGSVALEWTAGLIASLLLVPTFAAAEAVSRLPTGTAAGIAFGVMAFRFAIVISSHVFFEKKTHGLSLGGPNLFFVEPVVPLHPRAVRARLQARAAAPRRRPAHEPVRSSG